MILIFYLIYFCIIISFLLVVLITLIKKRKYKCKNYDIRKSKIDTIEILATGDKSMSANIVINIFKKFKNTSTNYVIDHNGDIFIVTPEEFRAWSTGIPKMDNRSITIMLCITTDLQDEIKYCISSETEKSLKLLCRDIMNRYNIDELKFNNNLGNFRFFIPNMKGILHPFYNELNNDEENINKVFSNYPKDYYICSNMERLAQDINYS